MNRELRRKVGHFGYHAAWGLMLLVVKRLLPDFGPIFARFATDLLQKAERVTAVSAAR